MSLLILTGVIFADVTFVPSRDDVVDEEVVEEVVDDFGVTPTTEDFAVVDFVAVVDDDEAISAFVAFPRA